MGLADGALLTPRSKPERLCVKLHSFRAIPRTVFWRQGPETHDSNLIARYGPICDYLQALATR